MFRRILFAGAVLLSASVSFAQMGQQRQDDLGIMSSPQSGQQPVRMNAPIQQVSPLQTAPVQSPTITNNPDYPRQPIFVPSPLLRAAPGTMTVPGKPRAGAATARQQRALQAPGQAPTEQRGRGAFTAPGVTQDRSVERNEFQQLIWSSTGHVLPLFGQNLFDSPVTFAPVENIPVTPRLRRSGRATKS